MGVDVLGVDEMGVDKMGSRQSGNKPFLQVGIAVAPSITDHLLPMFDDFLYRYHQV